MKASIVVMAAFIGLQQWVLAGDASTEPKELTELRAKYESEVEEAVQPYKDNYRNQLKVLLDEEVSQGDVAGALAVKTELLKTDPNFPFAGKWKVSDGGDDSIQFFSNGKWAENWNGQEFGGTWKSPDKQVATVSRDDNLVFHFRLNETGHLVRDFGNVDYSPELLSSN